MLATLLSRGPAPASKFPVDSWRTVALVCLAASSVLAGCNGAIDEGGTGARGSTGGPTLGGESGGGVGAGSGGGAPPASCKGPSVAAVPLQRLTQDQYISSVRDLLKIPQTSLQALTLPADERAGAFRANTIVPVVDLGASQYMAAATQAANLALQQTPTALPCPTAQLNAGCVTQLITQLGKRAYRRPLTTQESTAYATLVGPSNAAGDFQTSARLVIQAMLQSPNFLYRVELAPPSARAGSVTRLSSYELGTRLSYFLWSSTPDDALVAAAETGQLDTPQGLATQAQRLIADGRFKDTVSSFFGQWLELDPLATTTKDPTLFPSFSRALATAMQNEPLDFAYYVMTKGDRTLTTLLTAPYSIVTQPLLALYGTTAPAGYSAATASTTPVTLNPAQRGGLLTQAGFLAVHAHANDTSPVLLGKAVRQNFMCQLLPDPPPNVNTTLPAPSATQTTRARFTQHEADPVCGACHKLMDPIGFGFSNYDAVGAYRATENGQPIDASGTITDANADVAGSFNGAIDLGKKLAASATAQSCFSLQMMRFALARLDAPADACSVATVAQAFDSSGHDVAALMQSIVTSDAFQMRAN